MSVFSEPSGVLYEYPVHERMGLKTRAIILAVLLIPLLAVLFYRWPLDGACMFAWSIVTVIIASVALIDPERSPVILVGEDRIKVETIEIHPLQLEYIETYFDEGHFGRRVENRPHFVYQFHWREPDGHMGSHELLMRQGRDDHESILRGLESAIPGVRIHRLPDKTVRLRK